MGLQALCSEDLRIHVLLFMDNTTSCAYLRNYGGKMRELNDLAVEFWEWCMSEKFIHYNYTIHEIQSYCMIITIKSYFIIITLYM